MRSLAVEPFKVLDELNERQYSIDMGITVDEIVYQALRLPPTARAFVAEKLIESLDAEPGGELSPAWKDEIRKRCREIDEGLVELRNAEDVFAKAYAELR
jgi:hypothetical protein